MSPIRVGFLGLSASGSWAAGAHLPYLQKTSKYVITALGNSSVEAAKEAKKKYELPDSVKTYGDAADVANDEEVDLVVCSVRVEKHYDAIKPVLEKGKDVYVEWPLADNLQRAQELRDMAKKSGSKVMVGLQARASPFVQKVKEVIDSGRIGKVLSSTVTMTASNFGSRIPSTIEYLVDAKSGGNMLTIHFSHPIDAILKTLGELQTLNATLSTQRTSMELYDKETSNTIRNIHPDTPDQILLQGTLQSGAVFAAYERGGPTFPGQPAFTWRIYGDSGEILVISETSFINMGADNMTIQVHRQTDDSVAEIDWKEGGDEFESYSYVSQNVARLYEAFAEGKDNIYADWDHAVMRHRMIEQMQKSSKSGQSESYL